MDGYSISLNVWAFAAFFAGVILIFLPVLWFVKKAGGRFSIGKWSLVFDSRLYTYKRTTRYGLNNVLLIPDSVIRMEGRGWQIVDDGPAFDMLKYMWGDHRAIDISKSNPISYLQTVLLDIAKERKFIVYCKESQLNKLPGLKGNKNIELVTIESMS